MRPPKRPGTRRNRPCQRRGSQAFADQRARETVERIETRTEASRDDHRPVNETGFSDIGGAVTVADPRNGSLVVHVARDVCVAADNTTTARC